MNQLDIESRLDKELAAAELAMEKRLRATQKVILAQVAEMYRKYERDGFLTRAEMNKYNRLQKELKQLTATLTEDYQQTVAEVQDMQANHYLLKFLLTAYLLDRFIARPSLPSTEVIAAVFIFIIGALKLPILSKTGESDAVRAIEREFKRGIADNDSKDDLIKRIKRTLPPTVRESNLAEQLTPALIERIETPVNVINVVPPSPVEVRAQIKQEDKALTLSKTFTRHRNLIASGIKKEIEEGLKREESYAQMAKRIEKQFDMAANRARMVVRTESGRVRSLANEKAYEEASKYAESTKVWISALDSRVRKAHQKLDATEADKNGLFTYNGNVAKAPRLFVGPQSASLNINCRCGVLLKVDGKLPEYRRGRDYTNLKYQQRLADRIDELMADEGTTYKQSLKKAQKEILPPGVLFPYVSYDEWLKQLGERN